MRLFVALRPPPPVLDLVESIDWPMVSGLRWTGRSQWHVTLRFLGTVDWAEAVVEAVEAATSGVAPFPVVLGPASIRLGSGVLAVPASGADALAAAVVDATRELGRPPDRRPFRGHLTLARAGRSGRVPESVLGVAATGGWIASSVEVVRSHLGGDGPRYEVVADIALSGSFPEGA